MKHPIIDKPTAPDYSSPSHPDRTPRELFRDGYREAMLWANCYPADAPTQAELSADRSAEWPPRDTGADQVDAYPPGELLAELDRDADDFVENHAELIDAAIHAETGADYGWDSAGHDYALTRNGHGAGFWDRGLCDIDRDYGEELSDAARSYGGRMITVDIPRDDRTGELVSDADERVIWALSDS
jgi:hypothetical protein